MVAQPAPAVSAVPEAISCAGRRRRLTAVAVLAAVLCSGATSCTKTQVGLSIAAIGVAVVGITVGVTYAVQSQHHTLQGCLFSDAGGLKLRTSDDKVYTLKGDDAGVKAGERVKFHGAKLKRSKGDKSVDQVFVIEKLNKDYGPCSANGAVPPAPAR
jgi:hypothetical protein